ncbi:MAG: nucleotidyl transferase AbiEii/AbiGii toxin family protein [Flavobacteriales bacterium]|nr:nucleotidyl transferase AbiEii/AbiGii toxin family protein [Flavobacteriales bacterium]MBS4042161.1 nucleotidyl transferase AbiEii/AbiGii toxin family protein [Flavobacteriales bacterium]
MQIVPLGQLYVGKICAALNRQHPRDLFDVKYLLQHEGISEKIIPGFLYCLLGSERPIFELLKPNFFDQRKAMELQFNGMTLEPFTYEEYDQTRINLIDLIKSNLTKEDKEFLLQFENATPVWKTYDYVNYPSIRWKFQNLEILKKNNPAKHSQIYMSLKDYIND